MSESIKRRLLMNLLKRAGLTQIELAEQFKVHRNTVGDWVRGNSAPQLYPWETKELCQLLNCSLEELAEAFLETAQEDV